jgi:hypothetical protein
LVRLRARGKRDRIATVGALLTVFADAASHAGTIRFNLG